MQVTKNTPSISGLTYLVALLHAGLFVYAALTKLLDFESFRVQLGQSPLVGHFADVLAVAVPATELSLAAFLLLPRWRRVALHGSVFLMAAFSAYIATMLMFSPYVPCSCGGILDSMGWEEHLVFNLCFTTLGMIAATLEDRDAGIGFRTRLWTMGGTLVAAVALVFLLFAFSGQGTRKRNGFSRKFPPHPTQLLREKELTFNSYYLAGYADGKIYLGNRVAPLTVTVTDTTLSTFTEHTITIPFTSRGFRAPRVWIDPPHFYFYDGDLPVIYQGEVSDWQGRELANIRQRFTAFAPISGKAAAIRTTAPQRGENVLGLLQYGDVADFQNWPQALDKQVDGVYDTDGMLLHSQPLQKTVYVYYYRNRFEVLDEKGAHHYVGKTIDTLAQPRYETAYLPSKKARVLKKRPELVNHKAAIGGHSLIIRSPRMGRNEPAELWEQAAILDVYDLANGDYRYSFYCYDKNGERLDAFLAGEDHLITMKGQWLGVERFKPRYKP